MVSKVTIMKYVFVFAFEQKIRGKFCKFIIQLINLA